MTTYRLGDDRLQLALTQDEYRLTAELQTATGYAAARLPLLTVEVRDRMQERTDTLEQYRVMQVEEDEDLLHISVRDAFRGITVGLWLRLIDGELSILVPPAEVEESKGFVYRVYAVNVLPGLLRSGADGKLLLPVNTGVLCRPSGKSKVQDRFLIYGEQGRWELVPTLPIAAVQTPEGGLAAVATQGAADMWCDVRTDGEGHGSIGLYPMFRREWVDPVNWGHRELRIMPLAPEDDMVAATAKRLRRHVIEDLGKKTLTQRAEESAQCAYQQTAYTMKLFHGIQQQGIMMYGRESEHDKLLFKRTMRFRDAAKCLERLKAAGIDRVYLQSVGWNTRGHDGAWPTLFPIDERLGGESELRAMIQTAKDLGYQITTHHNCNGAYFSSPDFVADWTVHDIWGEPRVTGFWGGGAKSNHWGLAVPEEVLRGRLERLKDLGFNGMQYLDGMGNPLYVNYHPVHRGGRADYAAGINRYLRLAAEVFGAVQTEIGFLYCALHADALATPGNLWHLNLCKPEWPVTALLDQRVPVWYLALHDLVTIENHGVDWGNTMHAVLMGEVPRDEWTTEAGVFPVLDDDRIGRLKSRYDLCCEQFGHLITTEMTAWEMTADNVEQTTYADGTEVVADFNENKLLVNGDNVACPPALAPTCDQARS